jgi:hypothetical protein
MLRAPFVSGAAQMIATTMSDFGAPEPKTLCPFRFYPFQEQRAEGERQRANSKEQKAKSKRQSAWRKKGGLLPRKIFEK